MCKTGKLWKLSLGVLIPLFLQAYSAAALDHAAQLLEESEKDQVERAQEMIRNAATEAERVQAAEQLEKALKWQREQNEVEEAQRRANQIKAEVDQVQRIAEEVARGADEKGMPPQPFAQNLLTLFEQCGAQALKKCFIEKNLFGRMSLERLSGMSTPGLRDDCEDYISDAEMRDEFERVRLEAHRQRIARAAQLGKRKDVAEPEAEVAPVAMMEDDLPPPAYQENEGEEP